MAALPSKTWRTPPIRIAVSGAHGVGKTTFCQDLKAALVSSEGGPYSVELIAEVARTLKAEGVPINRGTEESQYAIFFERHISNLFLESAADFVVYDRTILDSIGYATTNGNLPPAWMSFVKTVSLNVIRRVDAYFFIPIEFGLEDDGVRNTENKYQSDFDRAIIEILQQCRSDFTVITGSRDERVRHALLKIHQFQAAQAN